MAILLYSTCGYFAVYSGMQYAVKKEVKRKLKLTVPKSELHLLKITKQFENEASIDIFERIHEGEFRYYGEMYDIVYKESRGDTTYYHCIKDDEEKLLFAGLSNAIHIYIGQNPHQQKKQDKLLQTLSKEYLAPEKYLIQPKKLFVSNYISSKSAHYKSRMPEISSPPPQFT